MTDYDTLYARELGVCGPPFPEFVDVLRQLPAGRLILDLGCGQGRDALIAARYGHHVVGVDLAATGVRQMVDAATAEGLKVKGVVADIEAFEPPDQYDVVILDRVLHMLRDDTARERVLLRAARAVLPHGQLLVADTPRNLPLIQRLMGTSAWRPTLARKGFLFWRRLD
jgi:SAM-dependent methyltransferase